MNGLSQFDLVAIYAAIVATAALALEVRRWVESGPRLTLSLMSDALLIGGDDDDDECYFALAVTNRGNLPTTITHMVVLDYGSVWRRLMRRPAYNGIVPRPNTYGREIPHVLEVGQMWHGQARAGSNEDLSRRRANGWLYVGIFASHRKRPYLLRVKKKAEA